MCPSSQNDWRDLREEVCQANKVLATTGLVILTFGNVSAREGEVMAIKPSGVPYEDLVPDDIPVLDMQGNVVFGSMNPSSDTDTHLELYRAFPDMKAITHTHSRYAVAWAQAGRSIPCYGTTHADYSFGPIPCTDGMTQDEVESDYELNTGKVAVKKLTECSCSNTCAVLVRGHGPFVWGDTAMKSVENSIAIEEIAAMAWATEQITGGFEAGIPEYLNSKHYFRKHGKDAYYGQ